MVSYTHPDHQGEGRKQIAPGMPAALATATRGQVLSTEEGEDLDACPAIDERELKRLEKMGAVTTKKDSLSARLALAGQEPDARMSAPYASLTSAIEQRRAAVAIAQMAGGVGPQSSKADLSALALGDLQRLALAFGAPDEVLESEDKDTILDFLTGDDGHGESAEDRADAVQARDEAQVKAREFDGVEPGSVGTNVTGDGRRADTGLHADDEERKAAPRRRSAAEKAAEKPDK